MFCAKETLRETIARNGVAVIPEVLDEAECEAMVNGIWDYLEHITQNWVLPIDRRNQKTWREFYNLFPKHGMLLQHFEVGHAQSSWDVRQNPKVLEIFEEFWRCDKSDLLSSFDGLSFSFPPEVTNRGWHRKTWYHTDQTFTKPEFYCLQSYVTGLDIEEGDATLSVYEGSHLFHAEFAEKFGITSKDNWHMLSKEQEAFYAERCNVINVLSPKGSLVLWDSRTIHCGMEPRKGRANPKFRAITYLCYMERRLASAADLKKKRTAFEEKRTTSHYPCKIKLFAKTPRTYGKGVEGCESLPDVVLDSIGRRLAGFD
uniref:Phytanoyl-CoA dioxygenase n=1 Tax=viral metagenome TaxID=1070528 RepID=A0A6C0HT12_9ZZZZ